MTELQSILTMVLAALPNVLTIIALVVTRLQKVVAENKIVETCKRLQEEVRETKSYQELKDQVQEVLRENADLKHTLNELLTQIDHIRRD